MSCRLSSRIKQLLEEDTSAGDDLLRERLVALPPPKRVLSHATSAPIASSFASARGSANDLLALASALAGELQRKHSGGTEHPLQAVASTPKTGTHGPAATALESSPSGHLLNGFWDFSAGVWALHGGGTCQCAPVFVAGVESLEERSEEGARSELGQPGPASSNSASTRSLEAPKDGQQAEAESLAESTACVSASYSEPEATQNTFRDNPPAVGSDPES